MCWLTGCCGEHTPGNAAGTFTDLQEPGRSVAQDENERVTATWAGKAEGVTVEYTGELSGTRRSCTTTQWFYL